MSQAKVDRRKEEKRNRERIQKKEKRSLFLTKVCCGSVILAIIGWIGFSSYERATDRSPGSGVAFEVNTAALDDFLNNMQETAE